MSHTWGRHSPESAAALILLAATFLAGLLAGFVGGFVLGGWG